MRYRFTKLNISKESIVVAHVPPYKGLDKANNGKTHLTFNTQVCFFMHADF